MITNILIVFCAIVILIGIIIGLMIHYQIIDNPFSGYNDVPDYNDDDDDVDDDFDPEFDDDDDYDPEDYPQLTDDEMKWAYGRPVIQTYDNLDDVHLMAEHLWGDATEYTVAHVRKLMEMEDDAIDYMNKQDAEVAMYLAQMAA